MFYNARWYDSSLSRFAQADTIVPNLIRAEDWDRYSYVRNNPLVYIDPSGHIPEEEICKYLDVCSKKEFREKYGQDLTELLWNTKTTWGDKLEWYKDGKLQVAMLVLIRTGNNYHGALWGIEGDFAGDSGSFDLLAEADKAKIEGENNEDIFISTVKKSEKYEDITKASDLIITNQNYQWEVVDYYDLPEMSLIVTGIGIITTFVYPPAGLITTAAGIFSVTVDISGYFDPLPGAIGNPIYYPILRVGPITTVSSSFGFSNP